MKLRIPHSLLLGGALALSAGLPTLAHAAFYGPSAYLSSADSPFLSMPGTFYNENFEDGLLNTPGASSSSDWKIGSPGQFTDSVDADDGNPDGSGLAGHSYYSNGHSSLTINFDSAALGGNFPTHAGIVWTDVGFVSSGTYGKGDVTFSAKDAFGNSLGSITALNLGDGFATGETAEDRFFGISNAAGISSITISMSHSTDWEVDHVQYGISAVPLSPALVFQGMGLLSLLGFSWRTKAKKLA